MVAVLTERKENEEIGEEGRQKRDLRSDENVLEFVQYGDQTLGWSKVRDRKKKSNENGEIHGLGVRFSLLLVSTSVYPRRILIP